MKIVVLSAGHGGGDPGAVAADGTREAELAVQLRDKIATRLRLKMVRVVTDGRTGENKPLRDALKLASEPNAIAVELHFNAASPQVRGTECLSKPDKKPLAQLLAMAASNVLGNPLRGHMGWRADNAGQHHRLAFCEAGGLILEVCFLSHAAELAAYKTKVDAVADALAEALRVQWEKS